MMSRYKGSGWHFESVRHSLARKGIHTAKKSFQGQMLMPQIAPQGFSNFVPSAEAYPQQVSERVPAADWLKGRRGDSVGHAGAAFGLKKADLDALGITSIDQLYAYLGKTKKEKRAFQFPAPKTEAVTVIETPTVMVGQQAQTPVEGILPEKKEVASTSMLVSPVVKKPKDKIKGFQIIPPSEDADVPVDIEEHRQEYDLR
jgi:hypothetical protein